MSRPTSPGDLIRFALEAHGVTQTRLAAHIGLSLTHLNAIVNNRARVTVLQAAHLASALDIGVEGLLDAQRDVDVWNLRHMALPERMKETL